MSFQVRKIISSTVYILHFHTFQYTFTLVTSSVFLYPHSPFSWRNCFFFLSCELQHFPDKQVQKKENSRQLDFWIPPTFGTSSKAILAANQSKVLMRNLHVSIRSMCVITKNKICFAACRVSRDSLRKPAKQRRLTSKVAKWNVHVIWK